MPEPEKKHRILVVDDEADTVIYMETLLQDNGFDTISATNGEEGLQKVKAEKPDLVLLDVSMPQKSGMRFFKEIKSIPEVSSIPIIFVTGVTGFGGDKDALRKFMSARGSLQEPDGFLSKPVDREQLLKTIRTLLSS